MRRTVDVVLHCIRRFVELVSFLETCLYMINIFSCAPIDHRLVCHALTFLLWDSGIASFVFSISIGINDCNSADDGGGGGGDDRHAQANVCSDRDLLDYRNSYAHICDID